MGAAFGARTNVYRVQEGAKWEIYHRPIALHQKIAQFPWRFNYIHSPTFRTFSYFAMTFMTTHLLFWWQWSSNPELKKMKKQMRKDQDTSPFAPIKPPVLPKVVEY